MPEDYIGACMAMGASAIALTDIDGVYGAPRLHRAAKKHGVQAHIGAEVTAQDGSRYTLLVESRRGYQNLCRLITRMKLRSGKKGGAALPGIRGIFRRADLPDGRRRRRAGSQFENRHCSRNAGRDGAHFRARQCLRGTAEALRARGRSAESGRDCSRAAFAIAAGGYQRRLLCDAIAAAGSGCLHLLAPKDHVE